MSTSWLDIKPDSDFSLHNLPYGIFKQGNNQPKVGVAIGEYVLDLHALGDHGFFKNIDMDAIVFQSQYLNDFIALGKPIHQQVRQCLISLLNSKSNSLQPYADRVLIPQKQVNLQMPVQVGDYTDFYSSEEHAMHIGTMFRGKENALMPNWKHLPVAYHGRASSIVVSGTPIHRPKGQIKPADADSPIFSPSQALDFELELAFVIGKNSALGETVSTEKAADYIFGFCLFNDWSARDIQRWEYVPLGPFLGKNFGSSISPWIVPVEALEPFKTAGPEQNPSVLPYLQFQGAQNFDLNLEVSIQTEQGVETIVAQTNSKYLYWNCCQQLAHHTINGCNIKVGDMMASGTISGKEPGSFGSMLELSWGGKNAIQLNDGSTRFYLHDHDTAIMRGFGNKNGIRVGFGEVTGKILPAL